MVNIYERYLDKGGYQAICKYQDSLKGTCEVGDDLQPRYYCNDGYEYIDGGNIGGPGRCIECPEGTAGRGGRCEECSNRMVPNKNRTECKYSQVPLERERLDSRGDQIQDNIISSLTQYSRPQELSPRSPERRTCAVLARYDHSDTTVCDGGYSWFKPRVSNRNIGICKLREGGVLVDQTPSGTPVNIEEYCNRNPQNGCCDMDILDIRNLLGNVDDSTCLIYNINLGSSPFCRPSSSPTPETCETSDFTCRDCPYSSGPGERYCRSCCSVNNR